MSTGNANMDPTYPLVPTANILACLLVICPLSQSMFQSWNIGACSFAIWVAVQSLTKTIRAIMWSDNVENIAPVWCDIGAFSSILLI